MATDRSQRGGSFFGVLLLLLLIGGGVYYWTHRAPSPEPRKPKSYTGHPSELRPLDRLVNVPQPSPSVPAPPVPMIPAVPVVPVPDTTPDANLKSIAALIQQGREAEAEARLRQLSQESLSNLRVRHYAAVLWNNLGVLQGNNHGSAAALSSFKTAVSLNPGDPTATVNLTHTLWELKDPRLTRELLENAIRVAPDDPLPHLALADMLYDRDDLAGAVRHLDHATERAASQPEWRSYLEYVTTKIRRAEKAERKYHSRQSSHFMVKFNGAEDYAIWDGVLDVLEDAYRDIGNRFGYYPPQPIIVVLHTRDRFHEASGSPGWADGLFDAVLGRIQIPTQGASTDRAWLSRVLRHEFVHALLHQRVDGRMGAVPTWLNEGLAMQLAGDRWPEIETLVQEEIRLMPLNSLEQGWLGLPPAAARLAYLEGRSAVGYLIDRYGMEKVREILGVLASGQAIGPAVHDRLFISYEDFQRRWVEELNQRTGRL
jgi:tetratricopeptide (TPR) repeat protein